MNEVDPRLHREILTHDDYWIMASARHPLAGHRVGAAELLQYPWVLGRRLGAVQVEFRRRFTEAGLPAPMQPVESSSREFLRALVSDGNYLTLLPSLLVQDELVSGEWVRLNAPGFNWQRPLVVYTREGEPQATPQLRLVQALRHAAAEVERRGH